MDGNNVTSNKCNMWATIRNHFRRTDSRGNKRDSHSTFHSSDDSLQKSLTAVTLSRTGSEATSAPKPVTDITLIPTDSEVASAPGHKSTEASVEVTLEEPICFTPKNSISWPEMDISPTKLINIEEAEKIMENDGIKQQEFYVNGNQNVRGAVYFLYGIGYGSNMEQDNKINKIESMVDESSGNLRRLSDYAFQTFNMLHSPRNKDIASSFLVMAVSLKLFFADMNAFGEFLGQPFMRSQKATNQTCWQCAACVWLSLLVRRTEDTRNSTYVVDISQRVRRYISSNPNKRDKIIEDRVTKNAGDFPYPFSHSFFGDGSTVNDKIDLERDDLWYFVNSHHVHEMDSMRQRVEEFGPGLISNFRLTEHFIAAAKKYRKEHGYWAFLGDSVDDEGEFVSLEELVNAELIVNDELKKFKEDLCNKVTAEIDGAKTNLEQLKQKFGQGRSNGNNSSTTTKGKNFEFEEIHCMVLLGGKMVLKTHSFWDKRRRKKNQEMYKHCYLCLNPWHQMSLVLVSPQYLRACGARLLFRVKPISGAQKSEFAVNENCLAVGMASPSSTCKDEVDADLNELLQDEYKEPEPCVAAFPGNSEDEGDY